MNTPDRTDAQQTTNAQETAEEQATNDDQESATAGTETPEAATPPGEEQPPEERIRELSGAVEALEAERDEINDRLLRKAAEFENYRRRMEREKSRRFASGKVEVVRAMLEVLDDFERSIEAAGELEEKQDLETAYESLKGGVEMVFRKFQDELKNLGVEPIEAEGEAFDEAKHEAMMQQPAPEDVEPGTVIEEIRKGYRMGDRIIRHSRVIVAT